MKDVFELTIRRQKTGEVVLQKYCWRVEFPSVQENLHRQFPAPGFQLSLIPSCRPYMPKKGEPTYKEWKETKVGELRRAVAR